MPLSAFVAFGALTASAATITVNTVSDVSTSGDGLCSLREAITNANQNTDQSAGDCAAGNPGLDSIVFDLPGSAPWTIAP
ncbi:MAG TPA: hypothetical protein VFS34_12475, partial [Thermoanaerobaculia bacterium]|nr:hypothetical protein [Thermoanaerobaculia bacterium]